MSIQTKSDIQKFVDSFTRSTADDAYKAYNEYVEEISLELNAEGHIIHQGHNDAVDAFRHAFTAGMFSIQYGLSISGMLGYTQELYGDIFHAQLALEKNMDLWNNRVGREIAAQCKTKEEFAIKLAAALKAGELITNLKSDSRKYDDIAPTSKPKEGQQTILEHAAEKLFAAQAHAEESNYWRNNFPILHKLVELPLENPILSMLFWRDPTRMLSESGRLTLPSDGYGYVPFMGFSGSSMGTAGLGPNPPFGGGGGSGRGRGSRFGLPSSTLGIFDSRFRPFSPSFNSGDSLTINL